MSTGATKGGKARPLPMVKKKGLRPVAPNKNVNAVMLGNRTQHGAISKQLPSLGIGGGGGGTDSNRPTPANEMAPTTTVRRGVNKVLPGIKSMEERFRSMLRGDITDMPPKPPSEVRIFLSSTFSDMRWERNELVRTAFPRLREYCAGLGSSGGGGTDNNEGVDFRVVDMRWGVTDDATSDHATEDLCLSEIADCQRRSLGTCFICILGDRYGYRPLPPRIPSAEYDLIYEEAKKQDHPKFFLLDQWYKEDENAVPPQYILQSIRSILPAFGSYDNQGNESNQSKAAKGTWWDVSDTMLNIIRDAVDALADKGLITTERGHDYHKSVTEYEIAEGTRDDPTRRCLCFVRRFKGLDNTTLVNNKVAHRFTEVANKHGQKVIDDKVAALRKSLQEKRMPSVLSSSQLGFWEVLWHKEGLDADLYPDHRSYIDAFTKSVTAAIMNQINEANKRRNNDIPASEYYTEFGELHHHLDFAQRKISLFRGQEPILDTVRGLLQGGLTRFPIVLYAESGGGKTSIMAKIFELVPQWFPNSSTVRVVRFLGTSPQSSDIYSALRSVIGQLADAFKLLMEPIGYRTHRGLMRYLPRFLRNIGRAAGKNHVVILLDSLDQLLPGNAAYEMRWLPADLPGNVHIIVSTLPQHGNILKNAAKLIGHKSAFVEVEPLPEITGKEILDGYLARKNRTLNLEQHDLLVKYIAQVPSPLYVKLLADRALSWKSYTNVDHVKIGSTVRLAIAQLFSDLESKYGEALIQTALGYLTIGVDGLTEVELEDALSCDDQVLNEVYQFHNPPVPGVVTIPPLLWARVRNDISEYLTERQSYGKTTLYWYHRQFTEVATEKFVNGKAEDLHRRLSEYFSTESSVRRDITLTKRHLVIHSADRQITPQPLTPRNHRKLQALPYHLKRSGDVEQLKGLALCSLHFMTTKIAGMGLSALISDYESASTTDDDTSDRDPELAKLQKCLLEIKEVWKSLAYLPVDLLARLEEDKDKAPFISALLQECRESIQKASTSLMPLFPCLSQSTLLRSIHYEAYQIQSHSSSGKRLVVGQAPSYKLIDVENGAEASLAFVHSVIPPMLAKNGASVYFTQRIVRKPKKLESGKKSTVGGRKTSMNGGAAATTTSGKTSQQSGPPKHSGVDIVVLRANVNDLFRGDNSMTLDECLTVQIAPEDLPADHPDIRINDIDVDASGCFLAMCFSDRYLIVKDLSPKNSSPGLISQLQLKGDQGLVSVGKTSLVKFTQDGGKVIVMVGCADDSGRLWTTVNIQDVRDKSDRAFHVPGLAWFGEVSLLMNDAYLFLAVKSGQTTRVGLVDLSDSDEGLSVDYLKLDMHISGITTAGLQRPRVYIASHQYIYVHDLLTRQAIYTLSTQPFSNTLQCLTVEDDEEHVYAGDATGRLHVWRGAHYLGAVHTSVGTDTNGTPSATGGYIGTATSSSVGSSSVEIPSNNGDLAESPEQSLEQSPEQSPEQEDEGEDVRYTMVTKDDGAVVVTVSSLGVLRSFQQDVLCDKASTHGHSNDNQSAPNEKLSEIRNVNCLLFHATEEQLVTDQKDSLKIWSLESFKCLRSNPKPAGMQFPADEMLWDLTGKLLYSLNRSTEFRLSICDMTTGRYIDVPEIKGVDVVAMTQSHSNNVLYLVTKHDGHCTVYIFDPETRSVKKSIQVVSKNTFQTNYMNVRLTSTEQYLIFMLKCTEREVQIVIDAEKKGNLSITPPFNRCQSYKFAALNLKQPGKELLLAYRQLTKIICLGSSMEILDGNVVLIGRQRVSIQWDLETGVCDSKIVRGTKTPQYFRPIWIEHDDDWGTICSGSIYVIHRNAPQLQTSGAASGKGDVASVVVEGSEDGWCMIYDETGQSVNTNMGKRSNHDGSPVTCVRVSPDSEWVLSASANTVMKCWSAADGREVFSIRLNFSVLHFEFDKSSVYAAVLGRCTDGTTKVALFMLAGR